jgi:hypothetical protein
VTSTTPRGYSDLLEDLRQLSSSSAQHLGGNGPEYGAGTALLHEGIDAEARQVRDGKGEVALQVFLVVLALAVVHDVVHHAVHVLVLHRRQVDAPHVAMHADHRRQTGGQMQVGSLVLDGESQQFGDVHVRFRCVDRACGNDILV